MSQYDELISDVLSTIGKNLYMNEETADFYFIFEVTKGKYLRIPAHKLLLIAASDVFRTMFNGTWKEKNEVQIVDALPSAFKEFLKFFYTGRVRLTTENVAQVMNLGKKYIIPGCLNVCETFVINSLTENSACWAYQLGIVFERTKLKNYCEAIIGHHTKMVLASKSFLECDIKVLTQMLKLDSLSCSEGEVFEACTNWVKATAKTDHLTRDIVQAQFGNLFYEIRFGSMSSQQFATIVGSYGDLFTLDEYKDISQAIGLPEYQSNLFNDRRRSRFKTVLPRTIQSKALRRRHFQATCHLC